MKSLHLSKPLRAVIRAYQIAVSPWLRPACRFEPSCSQFALEVLEKDGARRGVPRVMRRLLSCHPWGRSGFDPA